MYREQLLFVCSRNQWRSLTVAVLFKDLEVIEKRGGGQKVDETANLSCPDFENAIVNFLILSIRPVAK